MCLCLLRTIPVQQKLYRKLKRIHKWSLSNVQATFNLSYWVFDTDKGLEIFTSIRFRERPYTLKYRAKVSEYTIKYFICYAYSTFKRVLTQYTINHKETIIDNMYALLFITGNSIQAGHYKLLNYRYIAQKRISRWKWSFVTSSEPQGWVWDHILISTETMD